MKKSMTHYAVVQLVPTDAKALNEYRKQALKAVQKHGGERFAGGPDTQVLEDGGAPTHVVIAAFPSASAAQDWVKDPELAELHALRRRGAQSTIVLLAGA